MHEAGEKRLNGSEVRKLTKNYVQHRKKYVAHVYAYVS